MPTAKSGVKFRWNPSFFRELQNQREIGDALLERGDEIVSGAIVHAPRDTGRYASALSATKEHTSRGWVAYANAEVPYAWFVEMGTDDTPEFAPIRTAAEALGRLR